MNKQRNSREAHLFSANSQAVVRCFLVWIACAKTKEWPSTNMFNCVHVMGVYVGLDTTCNSAIEPAIVELCYSYRGSFRLIHILCKGMHKQLRENTGFLFQCGV
jgi:hypothetical protein